MRRFLRPLWFLLAILFLIEAWLWDRTAPIIARLVAMIPLKQLKAWLTTRIEALSPAVSLLVFLVPVVLLTPLKFLEVWFLAHEAWLSALAVLLVGKFAGVAITAFVFDITRPKLLQMSWFARLYDRVMTWRHRATEFLAPYRARLHAIIASIRNHSSPKLFRLLGRWRRRIGGKQHGDVKEHEH